MGPRGLGPGGGRRRGRGRGGGDGRGAGRGRGSGGGIGGGAGRGRRRQGMGFLRPALLTLLRRDNDHGYNLLQGLEELGIDTEGLDPSVVYRALRDMEEDGLVQSQWGDESLGPRRRVYSLTGEGNDVVAAWKDDLKRTRAEIDSLLSAMKQGEQKTNNNDEKA